MPASNVLALLLLACAAQDVVSQCCTPGANPFPATCDIDGCGTTLSHSSFTTSVASLAKLGDINGDGSEDFAYAEVDTAKIFVVFGQSDSMTDDLSFEISEGTGFVLEGEVGEGFGTSISGGFDINSDGFDDFVVGAPLYDGGAGRAFIIFGNDIFTPIVNLTAIVQGGKGGAEFANPTIPGTGECSSYCPISNETQFGISAASVGDVNDDGLDDILIGSNGGDVGAVLIFGKNLGTAWDEYMRVEDCDGELCARINTDESSRTESSHTGKTFGFSVGGGADFNGDGIKDMIIGAPGAKVGASVTGKNGMAAVFMGSDISYNAETKIQTLDGTTGFIIQGIGAMHGGQFGYSVLGLEDINGDGLGDFAVSIPTFGTQGQVALLFGFEFKGAPDTDFEDDNPRGQDWDGDTPLVLTGTHQCPGCEAEESWWKYPHTGNVKCVGGSTGSSVTECSGGFVIVGDESFGMKMDKGDFNNDGRTDMMIAGADSSKLHIVWGQPSTESFTVPQKHEMTAASLTEAGVPPICLALNQQASTFIDLFCAYADVDDAEVVHYISSLTTTSEIISFSSLGDVNSDRVEDFGVLTRSSGQNSINILHGDCNLGSDCRGEDPLPHGCRVPLSKLIPGFVDDDFLDWARGYIRYVMEQMEETVKSAWDENMLAKGFYTNTSTPSANTRCWCSPKDPDTNDWLCFDFEDLVCSGSVEDERYEPPAP